jgi:hypothetical protein
MSTEPGEYRLSPLQWKDDMLERSIFPMAYLKYNRIWHRLLLAAGLHKDTCIYSLRVGAAGRLDGEQFPPPFVKKILSLL